MIDAKEAVRIATESIQSFYEPAQIPHLALEEVELVEDGATWLVTMSFDRAIGRTPIEAMTGQGGAVVYKQVSVRAEDGQIRSVKNRQQL